MGHLVTVAGGENRKHSALKEDENRERPINNHMPDLHPLKRRGEEPDGFRVQLGQVEHREIVGEPSSGNLSVKPHIVMA